MERVAVIRTSDRAAFRRCRRKWAWQSHLKGNLTGKGDANIYLWFGTGIHFALEDFHGQKKYAHPSLAWLDFYQATQTSHELPPVPMAEEHKALGVGMLEYYADDWLHSRDPLTTYVHNGRICTEVNFEIPLPVNPKFLKRNGYDRAVYAGTLDRVIIDEYGMLWIVEYKTAKRIETQHFQVDGQCTAYMWAGSHLFYKPVVGVIYQQHLKAVPEEPYLLKGGTLSVNQSQRTTASLYRQGLIDIHGSLTKAPPSNLTFLESLQYQEKEDFDVFIRRDRVHRNLSSAQAEGVKIIAEAEEMLSSRTALYPNPTRDCSWDCSFVSPCISFDDGSDWESELEIGYQPQKGREDRWRMHLKQHQEPVLLQ